VNSVSPAPNATNSSLAGVTTATFNRPVVPASISFVVKNSGGTAIAGSVGYNSVTNTATFTPSAALAQNTTFTTTVNATDTSGVSLSTPYVWSFTTTNCPCNLLGNGTPAVTAAADGNATELGMKFTPDVSGYVFGVRFYKGATNTGSHVGSLWSSSGTLLASATFTNETASGWQQVSFSSPVAVTAGTTYVVSYHSNVGNYSVNAGYFAAQVDSASLHAPASAAVGGNGVYT